MLRDRCAGARTVQRESIAMGVCARCTLPLHSELRLTAHDRNASYLPRGLGFAICCEGQAEDGRRRLRVALLDRLRPGPGCWHLAAPRRRHTLRRDIAVLALQLFPREE